MFRERTYLCLTLILFLLPGCTVALFPAVIVAPIDLKVVDADTGDPINDAVVLRIVCDIHNFRDCTNGMVDRARTDKNGSAKIPDKRKWGIWSAALGGLPVPNHLIAIWKEGYSAFVFSQYENSDEYLLLVCTREDVVEAIKEIPQERRPYYADTNPFHDNQVKLYRK